MCHKDTSPESPAAVMTCYPQVNCPLSSVLRAMETPEVERDAKSLLDNVLATVSDMIENEDLASLLEGMAVGRKLFHFSHVVIDTKTQRTYQVTKDFMKHFTCEPKNVYNTEVVLADDVVNIAMATRGQSKNCIWHEERKFRIITSSNAHSVRTRIKPFKDLGKADG
ncbi:unnamed protein product [Ixodes pacificus]